MDERNKIAIYCRISTSSQNLYNQKIVLAEYAHANNFDYDIYEETESTRNTRPIKQELLTQIRLGAKYSSILVYSFDRWARDYHELLFDIKELTKHGIGFISIGDDININTEIGKEALKLLMAFYKFELDKISERTKLGMIRAKAEGKVVGRPHGSKDKFKRDSGGYILREKNKRFKKINDGKI